MEAVMDSANAGMGSVAHVSAGAQLPLSLVHEGESVQVLKVHGGQETRHHLAGLGFVEGAQVKVVSKSASGIMVNVKGATIAINDDLARKITTH